MKRISYFPYFFLILLFFVLLSLPMRVTERVRYVAVSAISPCWQGFDFLKKGAAHLAALPVGVKESPQSVREKEELIQKVVLLKSQLDHVQHFLSQEERLQQEEKRYQQLVALQNKGDFFKRRAQEVQEILRLNATALVAQVCFRQPTSWTSSLWINVGEKHNARLGKQVVCKNSPVIVGGSLVGVVEFVGSSQSRIRLITDSAFSISVRAIRGGEQNRVLFDHVKAVLAHLEARGDLLSSAEEKQALFSSLLSLKKRLEVATPDLYLAKGELRGSSAALWRSREQKLKGVGFNYDFADAEGPAREIRTGLPYHATEEASSVRLIEKGDVLVTTGLDGLFPAGLQVATVSSVAPLREGAIAYEIEAFPTASSLDSLSDVFVLPPLKGSI